MLQNQREMRAVLRSTAPWLTVAWLAVATPAWGQTSPARLQSLVNDAAVQLQLSYRHDPLERGHRHDELGRAISAWNKSARTAADNERLAEWLRQAMQVSMPGSREALPPMPEFPISKPPAEVIPLPVRPPASTTINKQPTAKMPTPAAESTAVESTPSASAPVRAEQAAGETAMEKVEKSDSLPGIPNGRPSATESPIDPVDGDPFRDDPLPVDK
jgi:hypothetical protein